MYENLKKGFITLTCVQENATITTKQVAATIDIDTSVKCFLSPHIGIAETTSKEAFYLNKQFTRLWYQKIQCETRIFNRM